VRVDHGRDRSCVLAHPIENLRLLNEPDVFQGWIVVLLGIGDDHFRGITDQKAIRDRAKPIAIDLRQEMMRHLLLIKDAFSTGNRAG